MFFTINITDEYLIYNFNGLDYLMKRFINDINNKISFYSIVSNSMSNKYFEEIKRDIIDNLLSFTI